MILVKLNVKIEEMSAVFVNSERFFPICKFNISNSEVDCIVK